MKLYTTTNCPKCDFIKGEIKERKLNVEIVNVEQSASDKDFLTKQNIFQAPVLQLDERLITDVPKMLMELEDLA